VVSNESDVAAFKDYSLSEDEAAAPAALAANAGAAPAQAAPAAAPAAPAASYPEHSLGMYFTCRQTHGHVQRLNDDFQAEP